MTNHPATAAVYPYKAVRGTCRNGTFAQGWDGPTLEVSSYLFNRYPHDPVTWAVTEESLLDALQKYGPLLVAVDASRWQNYVGGIFPSEDCTGEIDHAVQLVGYGSEKVVQKNGQTIEQKFWLLRNSWTDDWGESGFIRVPAFSTGGGCRINAYPALATF